ncbi:MAG: MarC family protein [Thermoguttaceae bacterium]|nr:MarC family protein [Thermoguttaceae bacterium]MDW8037726.1 MarC family protein [Thermoguttaceae bacterium]
MTVFSATLLMFLVIDPIGNIPIFLSILGGYEPKRARRILLRELIIALLVLLTFLAAGRYLLQALHISEPALSIAGGIILFLIALKMIFADVQEIFRHTPDAEPFVVPLAVPLIAGPSAMATVLLLMAREPARWPEWLAAVLIAWLASGLILLSANFFSQILGRRGLTAMERLMGMLLTTVAVQMFLQGFHQFWRQMSP